MAEKRLFKELRQLIKNPPQETNTQILQLSPVDEESSIYLWSAVIAKPTKDDNKYYYNGQWKLDIMADKSYPIRPPHIKFSSETPINHPNVNIDTGEICLDILKSDGWSPAWNLEHLVLAILMLIDTPEPDSPLNVDLANLYRSDKQAFESVVQYTMWKYGTFYEGSKEPSGVRTWGIFAYDISSEEEDELSEGHGESDGESDIVHDSVEGIEKQREKPTDEGFAGDLEEVTEADGVEEAKSGEVTNEETETETETETQTETETEVKETEEANQAQISDATTVDESRCSPEEVSGVDLVEADVVSHIQHVQSVGDEVAREFINKAIEVESSTTRVSLGTSMSLAVHDQVTKNVAKQVEEACRNTGRHRTPQVRKEESQDVAKIKEQFIRHIDRQVDEIQKVHEGQRAVVQ